MKTRKHRQITINDTVKICKKCGDKKPHRWLIDKRKKAGGICCSMCRDCRDTVQNHAQKSVKLSNKELPCKICGDKELHDWLRDSRHSQGGYFRSMCLKCHKKGQTKRWREIRRAAIDYLGGKCLDCGLERPETCIYDFHHRDPSQKEYNISDLVKGRTPRQFDEIKPELDKCDLLCAICHRLRHS